MKITILIMTIFLMQVSASTKAQITLNENRVSLQKVLKSISKQSGYDFIYSDRDLKDLKPVNIKLENASVETALQVCFEGQPLIYEISDKTVMVRKREEKSVVDRVKDFFTGKDIGGKVFGADGEVLEGATVTIKNSNKSTITNQYGSFYLKDVADDAIIVISYIGYKTQELKPYLFVNGKLNIQLEHGESKLDEVQVQAYGVTTRRLSTSDIGTVKAADIEKQPVTNPILALQGRVPGLLITPASGLPGAPITVQVRGVNTLGNINGIAKSAPPLFVIDGIPYANAITNYHSSGSVSGMISALSFINPTDIESIDVLKDADATAIYGSRGANGVILITTKKGKAGVSKIDLNISSGYAAVPKFLNLLNTPQYLEMRKEAYKNDGLALPTNPSASNYDLTVYPQDRYTDWQKVLLGGTPRYTNAQGTISGGSNNVQYQISGNFNKQGFVFPGDAGYTTGTGHFSISGNSLNNKFKATLTGSYTSNVNKTAADFTSRALALAPNAPALYNADGSLNWEPNPNSGVGTWQNPYAVLEGGTTSKTKVISSSASLSYQLLPSLMIKTDLGFSDLRGNNFLASPTTRSDPAKVNLGLVTASSVFDNLSFTSWTVDPQILFRTHIGGGRLDAIAGGSLQGQTQYFQAIAAFGFTSDALLGNLASAGTYSASNNSSQYKSEAVFARLTYNWNDRYIVNFNARRDGSSRFGPGNRFGNFGSAAAAWVFSNESFLQKLSPVLSFGKLRFSYGTSGNDGIGDYQYLQLYSYPDGSPTYQGAKGVINGGVSNPDYHWEQTTKAEIGLETGFFNDRILFSANYYRNRSSDQLGAFTLPATAGDYSHFVVNEPAKIQTSGLEFSMTTQNIKAKDFNWSTSANVSFERNKLLSLPADGLAAYGLSLDTKVGDPYAGVAYVYKYGGVNPATGGYQFLDHEGTYTSNPGGVRTAVNTQPRFYGGLSNMFRYKGISLSVFLQFTKQLGRNYLYSDVNNGPFRYPGSFNNSSNNPTGNVPTDLLARWRNPGDITNVERFTSKTSGDAALDWSLTTSSTAAYVDASYIKIKNVSLAYTIPQLWDDKFGIKSLRVYVQGQNLWTITGYKGLDPETQSIQMLPQLRVLTAGIQASF